MHPRLIGERKLHTSTRLSLHQEVFIAIAILLGAIGTGILVQNPFEVAQARPAPTPGGIVRVPLIPNTEIPRPPASKMLELPPGKGPHGEYAFGPVDSAFTRTEAVRLFTFYGATMVTNGWTFVSKAPPSPEGEWTISASLQGRQATIALYMIPRAKLVIDSCPPFPYC